MREFFRKLRYCFGRWFPLGGPAQASQESKNPGHLTPSLHHLAIIMDGNSRWAKNLGQPAVFGHRKGADAAYEVVKAASQMGIKYLTLFAFSSENWCRPSEEVADLMALLRHYLGTQIDRLCENGIALRVIGDRNRLDPEVREMIGRAEAATAQGTQMTLIMAISYGGREEITRACQKICEKVKEGSLEPEQLDEGLFSAHLDTAGIPDPDLLIRTGGERRISNFLCWQVSYAELYFTQVLWPDFTKEALMNAVEDYGTRERRFGRVTSHVK